MEDRISKFFNQGFSSVFFW